MICGYGAGRNPAKPRLCAKSWHQGGQKWGAARAPPKQCADNNNFQNMGDVVPCSFILPSQNPTLSAQNADFRFCTEHADFLHGHCKEARRRRHIIATPDLQSGYRIRADLAHIPRRPMRGKALEKRMGFDNDCTVNMRSPCKHPGAVSISFAQPQTRRWSGRAARRSDRQESGVGGPLVRRAQRWQLSHYNGAAVCPLDAEGAILFDGLLW